MVQHPVLNKSHTAPEGAAMVSLTSLICRNDQTVDSGDKESSLEDDPCASIFEDDTDNTTTENNAN